MSNAPVAPGTQSVDQNSLDRSLFQTLCITGVAIILLFFAFLGLRRCFPRLYAPSLFRETAAGKRWVRLHRWARPIFTVSDDFLFQHRGLDSLMYVTFSRMMMAILIGFFFFGILILWPVDGTASNNRLPANNPKYVNGTAILSFSNINSETESNRYTAHVLSVIFNSFLCYWLFTRTYNIYYKYTIKQWSRPDFSNYTILIDSVSRKMTEQEIFDEWNARFPGEVLSVHRVYGAYKLHKAYRERCDVDDIKAEAEWEVDPSKRYPVYDHSWETSPLLAVRDEESGMGSAEPEEEYKSAHGKKHKEKKKDKDDHVPHKPPKIRKTKHCLPCASLCCCKPKVDQLEYSEERLAEYDAKMAQLEKEMKPTTSVFITFNTRDAAAKARGTTFTRKTKRMDPQQAPDFNDIRWHSFEYGRHDRMARYIIILILTIFVGLIFFIPVTFAQGLANIATLAEIPGFNWLLPLSEDYPTLTSLIEGILPALVLALAFVIAKVFLKKVVLQERYFSRANEWRSFTSKYYYILVLNVFLASIAAGTFITLYNQVKDLVDDPISIIRLLAQRLPTQVNFFINYIAVNAVITNLIPLLQPVRFIFRIITKRCQGPKNWTRRNWLRQFNWLHYHEEYAVQLLYFTITIAYSSLAPLIIPFALILFSLKYVIGSYHSLYVFKRRYEGYGRAWPSVFGRLIVSMLLYQALMTGIFALTEFVAGIVICAILMIITIIYGVVVHQWYTRDLHKRSIEIDDRFRKPDNVLKDLLARQYRDPMRDWNIITYTPWQPQGVWFNSKDRLRQLQLSVSHPDYWRALQDQRLGFTQPTDQINTPEGLAAASAGDLPVTDLPKHAGEEDYTKVGDHGNENEFKRQPVIRNKDQPDPDTDPEDFVTTADEMAPVNNVDRNGQVSLQDIENPPIIKKKKKNLAKEAISPSGRD